MGPEHPNPRQALAKSIQHLCRAGRAIKGSTANRAVTQAISMLLRVPDEIDAATLRPVKERLASVLNEQRLHPFAAQELRAGLSHLDNCIAQARKD